jgi:predicted PurR-regulated permease PerM
VVRILQAFATSLSSILGSLVLILVYVLFLLYYRSHLKQFILKLSGINQREEMEKVIYIVAHVSQQYLVGLSKMIGCLWVMYAIGFSALGVKNALFFAFLCGILEIVPFIGNITGTSLTILVSAVQGESVPTLIGIAAVYALVQFIQGWILEPIIVGSQVKINPLFTIIALVVGQLLWGVPGIFLAIPLIAMFKIVCDHFESLKPIGFLIGETESRKNEVVVIQKVKVWIDKIPKK